MVDNLVRLLGILVQPPLVTRTRAGKPKVILTLATRRHWAGSDGRQLEATDQHRVVAYGPAARIAAAARQGDHVGISGRLQTRRWTDRGRRCETAQVVADRLRNLGPAIAESTETPPTETP